MFKSLLSGFLVFSALSIGSFCIMPVQARAQYSANQSIELSCVHLYPIQMKFLEKHINFSKLTPHLRNRTIDQFVKKMDGSKLYFLKSDQAKIHHLMKNVFAELKKKDCSSLMQVQKLFEKRVAERVAYAKKYLGPKFKFNPKAKIDKDPDERKWPVSMAAANRQHESYMQYQMASYMATDMTQDKARQEIVRNYERALRRVKDFKKSDLYANYLDSFARALDPHSSYFSADALEDFEIQMRLSLQGIGATLSSQDGFTVVEQLIPGGAAALSGKIKPKDKIIAVAQGDKGAFENVIEMDLRDVVRKIRGPKGSVVRLKILRKSDKESKRFEVDLTRAKINLKDEAASISFHDETVNGKKKKIALLNLPSFYADNTRGGRSAAHDVKKLLKEANDQKADAMVLDLSNNGGGSLRDAVEIAGFFFKTGNVVKQSERTESVSKRDYDTLADTDEDVEWHKPLVILVSRVSASASEIVSGTMKDYKRAVIVGGDHTFGKGTVQSVEYLPAGLGAIKTTVGMFFTAGGKSTQHIGVTADVPLPSVLSIPEIGEKTLDYSLPPKTIASFTSKTAYVTKGPDAWTRVTPQLVHDLRAKSKVRVTASKDFKKIKEDIAKNKKQGHWIVAGELLKNEKDKEAKAKKDGKTVGKEGASASNDDTDSDDDANLTPEQRKEKYFKRADVQEAMQVAADMLADLHPAHPGLKLGAKGHSAKKASEPTPN